MPDPLSLHDTLKGLQYLLRKQDEDEGERRDLNRSGLPPGMEEDHRRDLENRIRGYAGKSTALLETLVDFPPRHIRHFPKLTEFWAEGSFDRSVFIMTKFPDPKMAADRDKQLETLLQTIMATVKAQGYLPRIARGTNYHPGLWDNVELHLLGCRYGIAVVEDKYKDELNPNVAMEWGWMRAMDRKILFLLEEKFENFRADLGDLLHEKFSWDDPASGVEPAIKGFLK